MSNEAKIQVSTREEHPRWLFRIVVLKHDCHQNYVDIFLKQDILVCYSLRLSNSSPKFPSSMYLSISVHISDDRDADQGTTDLECKC